MSFKYEIVRLDDCLDTCIDHRGLTPKKLNSNWSISGYRAFSAKNIKTGKLVNEDSINYVDEELYKRWMPIEIDRGDILITSEAPFGELYYWDSDEKIVLSQRLFGLKIDRNICNPLYLYYWMCTKEFKHELYNRATGTTVIGLRQPELLKCSIKLPPIEIQNKIANILSSFDKKIELNTRINSHLEEIVFSYFKSRFKNTQYLCQIGDYVVPKKGKNLLSKDAVLGYVPVVAGGLKPSVYHNKSNTKAPVLTISASGANAGYIRLWHVPVWSSDSSYIDTDIDSNVYFWYVLLKSRQSEISDKQTGSAQPHIYPKHIVELNIPKYEVEDIEDFNNSITPYFELIGKNIEENKKLADMRDALLPKLMSGEIDI